MEAKLEEPRAGVERTSFMAGPGPSSTEYLDGILGEDRAGDRPDHQGGCDVADREIMETEQRRNELRAAIDQFNMWRDLMGLLAKDPRGS